MDLHDRLTLPFVRRPRPVAAYGIALMLAALGLGLRLLLAEASVGMPYLTFFPMVLLACAVGGIGPALVCALASSGLVSWFLLPPIGSFDMAPGAGWSFIAFFAACLVGCLPIELLHRSVLAQRQALAALAASEDRFAHATRAAFGMIYEWDVAAGTVHRSAGTESLLGIRPDRIAQTAEAWRSLIHPDDLARTDALWSDFVGGDGAHLEAVYRLRHADGRWVHVSDRASVTRGPDGAPVRVVGASVDITDRVEAEERLKAALSQRDAMIREVHHRVKNSLQTVSSLLNVQSSRVEDPAARRAFEEAIGRIQAVATVHQALYHDGDLTRVHLKEHIKELCRQIASVNGAGPGSRIRCELDVDDAVVAPDDLVPLALIVNELLTNAFRHAFPPEAPAPGGRVDIRFLRVDRDGVPHLLLEVVDDGVGLPTGLDPAGGDSLGLKLVHLLARQLGGTLTLGPPGPGARVSVLLPERVGADVG